MEQVNTIHEVLSLTHRLGIKLWVEADRLCYEAPKSALTPELRAQLRMHKAAIMAFLCQENPAVNSESTPSSSKRYLPPSFAQERFWYYQKFNPTGCFFNVPLGFRLTGKLDVAALTRSFNAIIRRHELLRTTLQEVDDSLMQVVAPAATVNMSVMDLQGMPKAVQSDEVKRLIREDMQRPFDLSKDYVLRVTLMQLEEESHILFFCLYRYIVEDRSLGVLFRELGLHYAAFIAGKLTSLPLPPLQYANYAQWERQALTSEGLESKLDYWRQWFAEGEPPPLSLPTDRPIPEVQTFRAGMVGYEMAPDLTQALKTLSQQTGTTLFMAILATYATLLSRLSGCEDIVVGAPFANCNHWMLEPLIGTIGDIMALRIDLGGNPNFLMLLTRVREVVLDTIRHQEVPFEQVAKLLHPNRQRQDPLFRVILSFLMEAPGEQLQLPGLTVTLMEIEEVLMRPDLTLVVWEERLPSGTSIRGFWQYKKDLFEAETIARLSKQFRSLCAAIATHPTQSVRELPVVQ
jgi:hypothetical protein